MNRKRLFPTAFLVLFMIFSLNFIACKGGDSRGNTVIVRLSSEPERLNPLTTEDAVASQISANIFQYLLDYDPQTFELTPVLAKSRPTVSTVDTGKYKGNVAYAYEIREEAKWDNGKPVTAQDYIFTVKTIFNKYAGASNLRTTVDFISDIVADPQNPRKFTIYSNQKYILAEIKSATIAILPEYVYDTEGVMQKFSISDLKKISKDTTIKADENLKKFATTFQSTRFQREKEGVVGSGAYNLDSWTTGQNIVLKKKKDWWGDKLTAQNPIFTALPEQISYKPVKDNAAALSMMKNGELDAMINIPPKDFNALKKDEKMAAQYNLVAVPALSTVYIGLNCKSPKLDDKRIRRALAHLFDVPTIIKTLAGGFGEPCPSPFIPQRDYFDKSLKVIDLNIEKSKTLLAEAGWKDTNGDSIVDKKINGKTTEMTLRYIFASANEAAKNMGLMAQENGKKIGIKINLEPLEAKIMLDNMKKRDFDMFVNAAGFEPNIDDPKEIWATSSNTPDGGNRSQFENKQADALINQIRSELDHDKRNALYKQFQALIYEEQPAIFLFARQERIGLNKRFDAPVIALRPGFSARTFKLKAN